MKTFLLYVTLTLLFIVAAYNFSPLLTELFNQIGFENLIRALTPT